MDPDHNRLAAEAISDRPADAAAGERGAAAPAGTSASARSLWLDRSFWGMTGTQFLGAFNDNVFKQIVLLMCLDYARLHQTHDLQPYALGLFAAPFILFSGLAGWLADRNSKRTIVVLCKVAEVAIVLLGAAAIAGQALAGVLAVLFLLGTHSAFFGPSKYGILPELVQERDLPLANGIFLMTTFAAIILGIAAAGVLKHRFLPGRPEVVAAALLGVALTGFVTSLAVRRTPVALPELPFHPESLAVSRETIRMFRADRPLLLALCMFSVFWLVGGIVHPAVNAFGKEQLDLDDEQTSFMLAFLTIGIALGCVWAGWASGKRVNFRLVVLGCWIMVLGLVSQAVWGGLDRPVGEIVAGSKVLLFAMGAGAGIFTVPLQVFLQARPPKDQKGRVIGAMNLINWIGIALSTPLYATFALGVSELGAKTCAVFGATALLLLPVAILYRPRETPRPQA